jgi:YHS domain-containing protein
MHQRPSPARIRLIAIASLLAVCSSIAAQSQRDISRYNLGDGTLGLAGFDPVAYFVEGGSQATPGKAALAHEHAGVVYHFSTEQHRELFVAAPERYQPAHGGWCAYAMSQDVRFRVDPKAFLISEGRLTLFADLEYTEFDGDWVSDQHALLGRAGKHWRAHSGESSRKVSSGSYRQYEEFNLSGHSLAIEGYDPVSYFAEGGGKPRKGSARWSQRNDGVLYHCSSEKNRKLFRTNPGK